MKPECISAEIERACARRARSSGHSPASGNRSARYSMIASESQIVTSPSIRAGTLPARRETQDPVLVGRIVGIERNENLFERDVAGAQRQPRPHRPGRIVLVADHEFQSHLEGILFLARSPCHSAPATRSTGRSAIVPVAAMDHAWHAFAGIREMRHGCLLGRYSGGRLLHPGMDGVCPYAGAHRLRTRQPVGAHECLPRGLGPAHARPRGPHGRHADHGRAAERHGIFRLHQPDRGRRRAGAAAGDQRGAGRARGLADRPHALAGAVGDQMRRADPDLRLRVLQIRLVVPAVQLCLDPARRDAAGRSNATPRKRKLT